MNATRMIAVMSLAACGAAASAQGQESGRVVRVLTIGNSFSGNATRYLSQLAEAAGHTLILGRADIGGCTMERHWRHVRVAEADPDDPEGSPYEVAVGESRHQRSLKQMLTQERWDVVTIQQASPISNDPTTYRPYARNLRDYVRKHAPQAEVVIHQTWAYRCDDPRFATGADSQENMYRQSRDAYRGLAHELGLRVIPVGDAFYWADTFGPWRYRPVPFDRARLRHPDLPDQSHSLHVGWYWGKGEDGSHRLAMDGHHASAYGCYLAGCVWFEFLFGDNVEQNPFVPDQLSAADARVLRYAAHRIMREAR